MIPDWNKRAKGLQVPWPKVWYGFLGCRISLMWVLYVEMESSVESGVAALGGGYVLPSLGLGVVSGQV